MLVLTRRNYWKLFIDPRVNKVNKIIYCFPHAVGLRNCLSSPAYKRLAKLFYFIYTRSYPSGALYPGVLKMSLMLLIHLFLDLPLVPQLDHILLHAAMVGIVLVAYRLQDLIINPSF